MPLIDAAGHRIACTQAGTSPAVVLLHGSVGDGEATWHPQLRGLRDNLTVVALGCPRRRWVLGPSRVAGPVRLRGRIGRVPDQARSNASPSHGPVVRRHTCPRVLHPTSRTRADPQPRLGIRRLERIPGRGSRQHALVQAMQLSELPAAEFVDSLLPTMFRSGTPQPVVQHFADSMRSFHPVGFRAMARASAGDLREVLPQVRVPTLVIAGANDARAPLTVAMVIHAAIAGSRLVVIPTPATCATRTGGSVQRDRARVPVRAHPLTWALPPSRTEVSTVDRPSWT